MNFFKSLISDDPDPLKPENSHESEPDSPINQYHEDHAAVDHLPPPPNNGESSGGGGAWSFGGLIQTLTTRSESVLETYRRDLEEFGSGLKKETEIFREAASRAVKELPASIEVAHGAIDGVIKSTAEIISSQNKETLPLSDDIEAETNRGIDSGRYSWFEAQLNVIQSDINTYCEEPEDLEDYNKWKLGYSLIEKSEKVENLMKENGALESIYKRVVPNEVDNETFWCRYFYRVDKLKQQESVRANLVRRAISIDDDEEELSWDVDDDDDNVENEQESSNAKSKELETRELGDQSLVENVKESSSAETRNVSGKIDEGSGESKPIVENVDKGDVVELREESGSVSSDEKVKLKESSEVTNEEEKVKSEESNGVKNAEKVVKSDEKVGSVGKSDEVGSGKDSKITIVPEEEDLEWDEIEDIESNDEKKVAPLGVSLNRADIRKPLIVAEADEDLSWDIEDDDEPVKT